MPQPERRTVKTQLTSQGGVREQEFCHYRSRRVCRPASLEGHSRHGKPGLRGAGSSDSVGILDQYSPDACFFTEFERFDRHIEKLRRGPAENRIHYLSICVPNHLHDAHARFALRVGADAICEKPLVLNPWNCDALQELEAEYGRPGLFGPATPLAPLADRAQGELVAAAGRPETRRRLTYITSRGPWYLNSWKGNVERSGGLATNIGIHFFDMLLWLFGPVEFSEVHEASHLRSAGRLELQHARVQWFLSIDRNDLPEPVRAGNKPTFRSIAVDDQEIEFSENFTDLHTRVYEEVLAGRGFGVERRAARDPVGPRHPACGGDGRSERWAFLPSAPHEPGDRTVSSQPWPVCGKGRGRGTEVVGNRVGCF